MIGFLTQKKSLTPNNKRLSIILKEDVSQLSEITIDGKTKEEEKRHTGYAIGVLQTKKLKNLNADINQILKTTSGINIRETGGLGSGFNLSLNGLSGNQIRFFINGVPMENFGSSLTLNNYPINLVEAIEIYKGVVPVSLGADALGGAINIITENKKASFIDASYSFGSFNTHRFAVNAKYYNKEKKYFSKINSFINHSDNDFLMKGVPIYDQNGNKLGFTNINRFNDSYTSGMLSAEFGIFDRKIADSWSLKITYAKNKNNYQHPDFNILRPFGDFNSKNNTILLSSTYKKHFDKFSIVANVLSGTTQETVDDTGTKKYNWLGQSFQRAADDPKGELFERRSLFTMTDQLLRSQVYVSYKISNNHKLEANISQNYLKRKGKDAVDILNRSFINPNTIQKYMGSFSYNFKDNSNLFDFSAFVKNYRFKGKIISEDPLDNSVDLTTKPSISNTGYGSVLAYHPLKHTTLKASYEKAYRLPEPFEILGDGIYIRPNAQLQPEVSDNLNIGIRLNKRFSNFKIQYEGNIFYRWSRNFIQFKPAGVFGTYTNLAKVTSKGIENGIRIDYKQIAILSSNITYQNITEQNQYNEEQLNSNYKGKVPNTPFFFANVNLAIKPFYEKLEKRFTFYWNTRFVDAFFLKDEKGGNREDKHTIPQQLVHGIDLEYTFPNEKLSISSSISNVTDALLYDNFRIQKPGRAFSIKLRYFL
jgi:outer membrane cobalamin receptor